MRMRLPRTARPALVAGALLVPFLALPAAASPAAPPAGRGPGAVQPEAHLDLAIHQGGMNGSVVARAVLACLPVGGTHPHRASACAALERAGADFTAIPANFGSCPTVSSPVTVTANGFWKKKAVDFRKEYPNRCLAERATGEVFRF
ncbi:SSI family serine proteinase inhibitor [Streptomyces meridianus]|uniref:Subtilase-type protease inhibitor n=1 Tax=Streptomyces meridianus TaxID=2938945 RepID=A0ABT0X695_9ACTN|nr:SSI family serine proteinase inhibitor [Streptomyces meridianus]MCM2577294.1 subtilase-type protease inhibitor [Streptomyces meridianus]